MQELFGYVPILIDLMQAPHLPTTKEQNSNLELHHLDSHIVATPAKELSCTMVPK